MALAGIELRYLVNQISDQVQGYYVSNIYGVTKDSILFKLHHTEKSDLFMMVSTSGVWLTSVKIEQIEPNRLLRRLRGDIIRLKLKKIEQIGAERIAYFFFEGFGKEFVLVGEFFGDGNIILCNDEMKILALQHSIDVRHRKLGVGLQYAPPPSSGLDIFGLTQDAFDDLKTSDLGSAKWLGRTLGLPKKYVEAIFEIATVDQKKTGTLLTADEITKLFETTKGIVTDVTAGNHDAVIIRGEKTDVLPLKLGRLKPEVTTSVGSFIEGLDTVFTENILEVGRAVQSSGSDKKIKQLETQISEQEKAILTVKERSKSITSVANSFFEMVSAGILSVSDKSAQDILERNNAKLVNEKGVWLIIIQDEKIKVNINAPLQSIASTLFNEAKKQSGAISSIQAIKEKTAKKLAKFQSKTESEQKMMVASEIRKKMWYERYRWFFTTDGLLTIGGRDAASNSAVIRKHLGNNDCVFHADIFGSPFFILKDAKDVPDASMNEIAHATVCFSRAWREGLYGVSAFWVNPQQVKKSAPSGEFLPKGSFTIEGQRNFIKSDTLRLAVGIIPQRDSDGGGGGDGSAVTGSIAGNTITAISNNNINNNNNSDGDDSYNDDDIFDNDNNDDDADTNYVLTCGPPEPIKKYSILYAIIEPHGSEMVDTAKKIRIEFSKLKEDIAKSIPVDDYVRVLPAGKSQIVQISHGDARL